MTSKTDYEDAVRHALVKSIEHWSRLSTVKYFEEIEDEGYAPNACALCQLFNTASGASDIRVVPDCAKCPVAKYSGFFDCKNTPYSDFREAFRKCDIVGRPDMGAIRGAARKEMSFLITVLDEYDSKASEKKEHRYPENGTLVYWVEFPGLRTSKFQGLPNQKEAWDLGFLRTEPTAYEQRKYLRTKAELAAQPGAMLSSEVYRRGLARSCTPTRATNDALILAHWVTYPRPGAIHFGSQQEMDNAVQAVGHDRVLDWLKNGDL